MSFHQILLRPRLLQRISPVHAFKQFSSESPDLKKRILYNAIRNHQPKYGWTEQCIIESVKELNLNPVLHTIVKRGPVELVEIFVEMKHNDVLEKVKEYKFKSASAKTSDTINNADMSLSNDSQHNESEHQQQYQQQQTISNKATQIELLEFALNAHIDYFQPYKSSWSTALVLLAEPAQVPYSLELMQKTLNDLCSAIGIETTRYDWYTERSSLIALMGMMEFYMIQDSSPNSADTRAFVKRELEIYGAMKEGVSNSGVLASALGRQVQDTIMMFIKK